VRIALISPFSQIESTGLRILSACLKRAGFETRMIFLPDLDEMMVAQDYGARQTSDHTLAQIVDLCGDAGLVGITVMTNSFILACQLSAALRTAYRTPIVWGGVHPTVRPVECLRHADLVCIGEGEHAIVEMAQRIAQGADWHDVPNVAYLRPGGDMTANPLRPLAQDLDALPFPDYDYQEHYVLHEGQVVRFTQQLMHYYLSDIGRWTEGPVYALMASRGCPYRCAYCVNNAMATLYPDWCTLRRRSPQQVIAEIQAARARFPAIAAVNVRDDVFLANPISYIAEFARLYSEQVGLPFRVYTTAQSADRAKFEELMRAGLRLVIMGIQTGSERTQELYRRHVSNAQILRAAHLIHNYRAQVPRPIYDLITDNPYESADDRCATLRLVHQLPRPFKLSIYSLTLFPGTGLYERAKADGLVGDEKRAIYEHNFQMVEPGYYNLALFCHHWNLPGPLLDLLTQRAAYDLLTLRSLNWLCGALLRFLLAWRLMVNRRLYRRYRGRWLFRKDA
jgi:anaerobic magnesium-protoporphyrin IX monomethyl ester cyclase